ncbi:MAG TPA: TlpA disulfide reductase family protein [bacterium]|nr:TlpA disulfide reductase family protein [bacterium]
MVRFRPWPWVVVLAVAVIAVATAVAVGLRGRGERPGRLESAPPGPAAGPPAPDFRLRAFDGRSIGLSDFAGRVVVLNFWASWCTPCKEEMPTLERVWREFRGRGVVVLGVNVLDDRRQAEAFLQAFGITYPNVFDPGQERMLAYRVTGLPTTVFIDRQRRIRAHVAGGYLGPDGRDRLRAQILALLEAR